MPKAPRINATKSEISLLNSIQRGNTKWDELGLQLKVEVFFSKFRDDAVDEEKIEQFANKLGVSTDATRDEVARALENMGIEVERPPTMTQEPEEELEELVQ